ncbi:MAG: hypothetical protein J5823_06505 [Paludibacteraceae bacterium]|nr:hypothetical protein [Paludibacteraceae bacterium]
MSMEALLSASRQRDIVVARHVAMYLASKHTAMTKSDIGRYMGNRTNATVLHALEVLNTALESDVDLGRKIRHIENHIAD